VRIQKWSEDLVRFEFKPYAMIEFGSEAMTFSRLLSNDSKVDQLRWTASSDMSNWKSCGV
jgi:hypothetical protein